MINHYQPFQPILTQAGLNYFNLTLQSISANSSLNGIVHSYLQISTSQPTPYPIIPDGTQALFFSNAGSLICGAQTQARNIQLLQAGDYFGIHFYPGALRYFFKLDLFDITNQLVDYHFIPCTHFKELHNIIYLQQDFHQRAKICEQWLMRHFTARAMDHFDFALSLIYQSTGKIKITQLADKVGWSSRHLNRLFRLHTGLSTKVFTQTIRMQQAFKNLYLSPGNTLNSALELGYFDHSHLIRAYKKYLLTKPSTFFSHFMSDFSYR